MAETVARPLAVRAALARAALARAALRMRARRPGLRRQREYARLALTELDVRRLDDRIDALLSVLAQVCDYSSQPDAAREFRSLCSEPVPAEAPVLRLVRSQP